MTGECPPRGDPTDPASQKEILEDGDTAGEQRFTQP